jgi:hypothetical protein
MSNQKKFYCNELKSQAENIFSYYSVTPNKSHEEKFLEAQAEYIKVLQRYIDCAKSINIQRFENENKQWGYIFRKGKS